MDKYPSAFEQAMKKRPAERCSTEEPQKRRERQLRRTKSGAGRRAVRAAGKARWPATCWRHAPFSRSMIRLTEALPRRSFKA